MSDRTETVNKQGWFWLAPEYFDKWRVFPRAFVMVYFWLIIEVALWFMGLPNPSMAQATFASAIISAGAAWFGLYVRSGGDKAVQVTTTPPPVPTYTPPQNAPVNTDGSKG